MASKCKKCLKYIVWTISRSGKFVPIEPSSFDHLDNRLDWDDSEDVPIFSKRLGHEAHFESCSLRPENKQQWAPASTTAKAYAVLFVVDGAHPMVVRAAYRALSKIHHPDVGGDGEQMRIINGALETLEKAGVL